ncbi:MAG: site-specific integrase [Thiotrichales bacterium]
MRGRKLKAPEARIRWIKRPEAAALIASARRADKDYLADFLILALNTGCRKQEMLGLEWSRVSLQDELIHLEADHTKSAKRRSIPLNADARSALLSRMRFRATHCPASPWVFAHEDGSRLQDVKKSFARACAEAGIKDFRIHDLRHTCAAWLVTAGAPLPEVRDLLGHASVTMTEKYAHLAPERVRAAVTLLESRSHDLVTLEIEGRTKTR